MTGVDKIEQLAQKLSKLIPPSVNETRADIQANIKDTLAHGLRRMDLVTREEFDVQTKVLETTRERLEALERRLTVAEAESKGSSALPKDDETSL